MKQTKRPDHVHPKQQHKNTEFHPKKSLGQNFLTDESLFQQLVSLAGVSETDNILEIGAGAGGMTRVLAQRCGKIISVEVDGTLLPILRVALEKYHNVELVHGDVMRLNLPELTKSLGDFHIVANIPYYLTTDLMTMLLRSQMPIQSISVMVQKEAAERIVARPGEDGYGMLAVRSQYMFKPEIALDVPACMFTPPPKVDSAFVTMQRRKEPKVSVSDEALFFRIAAAAFAMRRKTMENNLMNAFQMTREKTKAWMENCNIPEGIRGELLSMEQFAALCDEYTKIH